MGRDADMERLAQALHKLGEDDLLQIVRIVNEHKTPEMYVKNDLEGKCPQLECFSISLLGLQILIGRGRVLY